MKNYRSIFILVAALAAFGACEKDAVQEDEITLLVAGKALVKFFHFGVNGPSVNFYANNQKLTAIQSLTGVEATTGTSFNGVGVGGLYTALDPGQYTLSGRIAGGTDKDLAIAAVTVTLMADKQYSFYLSGNYNATTKQQDAFVVEDDLPPFDFSRSCVRFVNAIANAQPLALYVRNTATPTVETKLGPEVPYKQAGAFVCLPGGLYDVFARTAGSSTNAISRTGVTFQNGRVSTISARGDMSVTSTTSAIRPLLDLTANR